MSIRVYLSIALALLAVQQKPAIAEPRRALVIGNGAYSFAPLSNPVNDVRRMERALTSVGFEVARLENATKPQIEAGLRDLSERLTPDAVSLFYYAGHGVQVGGHSYLIPTKARIDSAEAVRIEAIDLNEVVEQVTRGHGRVNIIILDACRNSPFDQPEMTLADGEARRIDVERKNVRFRGISGGLAPIEAPAGILIAYATAPGKTASDGTGRNGLYTSELIREISTPGISIEQVFKETRRSVIDKSQGAQTPWESSSLIGDFTFQTGSAAPAGLPAGPTTTTTPGSKCFTFNNKEYCE